MKCLNERFSLIKFVWAFGLRLNAKIFPTWWLNPETELIWHFNFEGGSPAAGLQPSQSTGRRHLVKLNNKHESRYCRHRYIDRQHLKFTKTSAKEKRNIQSDSRNRRQLESLLRRPQRVGQQIKEVKFKRRSHFVRRRRRGGRQVWRGSFQKETWTLSKDKITIGAQKYFN